MRKIAIIGHFAYGLEYLDGQTVKTKIITEELCKTFDEEQVLCFDTHGGAKALIKAPWVVFKALYNAHNVIIFPAHNGLRVYGWILPLLHLFFKDRKIHYVVIGGWLPRFLQKYKFLSRMLKKFDGIYVETNTMKSVLDALGFENVYVMRNCKYLTALSETELVYSLEAPYKLCTFSRVMKEKGIETAMRVVKQVNDSLGYTAYSLDVYGQVDSEQIEWFENLKHQFPDYIQYCGCVDAKQSVEVLKKYFGLLFPTHFYTEGIPGTIIDAYAAGIPVISSRWENYTDVIEEGITGIGYEFDNAEDLKCKLMDIEKNIDAFNDLKINCLKKSRQYTPSQSIHTLVKELY